MLAMQSGQSTRNQRTTMLTSGAVGLMITTLVVVLLLTHLLDAFELMTLDMRFKYANQTPTDPSLALVAIDDGSLKTVGRWPWSRAKQASMIRTLGVCGVKALIIDIEWADGEPVTLDLSPYEDLVTPPAELAASTSYRRFSDGELVEALRNVGNAYVAFRTERRDPWYSPLLEAHLLAQVVPELNGHAPLSARLQAKFDLVVPFLTDINRPLSEASADPNRTASDELYAARRAALRVFVRASLHDQPDLNAADLYRQTLSRIAPEKDVRSEDALSLELRQAVIDVLGEQATERAASLEIPATLVPPSWSVERIDPALPTHAKVAQRCGFVSFKPDFDNVARHLQLITKHGDTVLPQLGFAYACDALGAKPELLMTDRVTNHVDAIQLGNLRIQVDDHGRTLIPWIAEQDWTKQFAPHIPADVLVELGEWQAQLIFLRHQRELSAAELFLTDGMPNREAYEAYLVSAATAAKTGQLLSLSEQLTEAEQTRRNNRAALIAAHDAAVKAHDAGKADELGFYVEQLQVLDESLADINATIEQLQQQYTQGLQRVRPLVEDRVCFIGYTASALADMTPIPTNPRAPGVLAHMNLVNGLLTGNTIHWRPVWVNVLLTALLGVMTTLTNATLRPRSAAALTFLIVAGFMLITYYLFYSDIWLEMVPPALAGILAAIGIQFYRFVFVDRERRQLSTALSQYTSPAIARLVAEDVELCRRAEQREVTVIFTDLKGFTTISERIGAQRTQAVLNTCLGRFTDVIQRREGLVNKFLGDGVFAFWNPVIYPQDNHAQLGIQTAFDLCDALEDLRVRYIDDDPTFADLAMRIGVATGEAVVGPCGSEQKYDYTCIGDTVNLAARLESANKYFGTAILINQALRDSVGDAFEYREIGSVQVKGKRFGVPVFEPLGPQGQVPDERRRHAERFAAAVAKFVQRDWQGAGAGFGDCIIEDPNDLAAMRYAEWCDRFAHQPPDEDWNGALELMEK